MVLIWFQITILFYCLGGYNFYPTKDRGSSNYDKDLSLEAWILICFWLTNEKISEGFCSSELLYSLFSAIPESFVRLQRLNPRDVVFKFFPLGSWFFFQKKLTWEWRVSFIPHSIKFPILLDHIFATLRESLSPGGLLTRLVYELINCSEFGSHSWAAPIPDPHRATAMCLDISLALC